MEKTWDCSAYARAKAQREILSFSVFQKKKSSTERKISYNHAAEPAATEASQGPRQVVRLVQAHILGVFSE